MASLSTLSPDGHCLAVAHGSVVWLAERDRRHRSAVELDLPDPCVGIAMTDGRLFAVTASGMLVMADRAGKLGLRRRIGARGVGVGCHSDQVVAFTDSGWLRWRIGAEGHPDGRWGKERAVTVPGVVAGACARDGRVAVVTTAGELHIRDARDRREVRVSVGEASVVVPGGPQTWFVARDREVIQVKRGGALRSIVSADTPVRHVAASPDGGRLAVALGDEVIVVWNVGDRTPTARLQVFDRRLTGLCFGSMGMLAWGLDRGDGNWFDLATQRIVRNQPPLGALRRTWPIAVNTEPRVPVARPGIGPDDPTVEASRVLAALRPLTAKWWGPTLPEVLGAVALAVTGLVAGWLFGSVVHP